jgi:riboflavin synthase
LFTGIVEEIGVVRETRPGTLVVAASVVLSDLRLGDSIAIDGICLTVIQRSSSTFTVNVQPETLRRTTAGQLPVGQRVNLERAVQPSGRLGGHIVQGHIDDTGRLAELRPDGDGLIARIEAPRNLMRYVVRKGFIAVSGVSLTVVDVSDAWFTVALVAYTRANIALLDRGIGTPVNLEVDVLAKYVERLLQAGRTENSATEAGGLTLEKLHEAGFAR